MRVIKSNTTRIVIACFLIFMAIPFFFVESSDGVKQSGVSIPMETNENPLSKFINRIASFYGFKKKPARSSVLKNEGALASAKLNSKGLPEPSADKLRAEGAFGDKRTSADGKTADGTYKFASSTAAKGSAVSDAGPRGKLPEVKEYIRMDGETYEVIADPQGRKFVAMPDGFIPYEQLMADTVSQEEFDAARAQAPQLEDWEIFEALRTPGGLPAYLNNGGNNAFSKNGNKGYYDKEGKEGSRLFGMRSSGRVNADGDDIYDERKFNESVAKHRKLLSSSGSGSALNSRIKDKYIEARRAEEQKKAESTELASLIRGEIVIGNTKEPVRQNEPSRVAFRGNNTNTNTKGNLVLQDKSVSDYMKGAFGVADNTIDEWTYPEVRGEIRGPLGAFQKYNQSLITDKYNDKIALSDEEYKNKQQNIGDIKVKTGLNLKIAVVDGIDYNTNTVKPVDADTFHYKIVSGLLGADSNYKDYIEVLPEQKADTLLVVSNKDDLNRLKNAGYNAVLFNRYAITPEDTENFYRDAYVAVSDMAKAKQESALKEKAKIKEIASSRVGVRGI